MLKFAAFTPASTRLILAFAAVVVILAHAGSAPVGQEVPVQVTSSDSQSTAPNGNDYAGGWERNAQGLFIPTNDIKWTNETGDGTDVSLDMMMKLTTIQNLAHATALMNATAGNEFKIGAAGGPNITVEIDLEADFECNAWVENYAIAVDGSFYRMCANAIMKADRRFTTGGWSTVSMSDSGTAGSPHPHPGSAYPSGAPHIKEEARIEQEMKNGNGGAGDPPPVTKYPALRYNQTFTGMPYIELKYYTTAHIQGVISRGEVGLAGTVRDHPEVLNEDGTVAKGPVRGTILVTSADGTETEWDLKTGEQIVEGEE